MYIARHHAIAHLINRLQYSVNKTFICTGKPKGSRDLLYYNNQTDSVSKVFLYLIMGIWSNVWKGPHRTCDTSFQVVLIQLSMYLVWSHEKDLTRPWFFWPCEDEPRCFSEILLCLSHLLWFILT